MPADQWYSPAFPAAGTRGHYYDLAIDGYPGYSQAAFHAAAGDIFLCCDPVAIGDSDVPTQGMDYDAVGRANAATVRAVVAQLAEGGVVDGLGPVEPAAVIAMGQSFGGFCLTMGQAVDPYFDAVAFLGWSGLVTLPPFDAEKDLSELLSGEAGDGLDHPMRPWFHHDSEPEELIRLDMARAGSMGSPEAWGASTLPGGPALTDTRWPLEAGIVAAEAASIRVPVFIGAGVIDVVGDPWAEPSAYRASRDITVAVYEDMAHMHNFANTRRQLWERLATWGRSISRRDA